MRLRIILLCIFAGLHSLVQAQINCPTNIDFELGNFTNWKLYTGTCCAISTPTLSGPVAGRHTITSGTGTDPYGGFPIVAPASGNYSLKLGNNSTGAQAERARYFVHVPSGVNNYSVIFRYAVVFQDPGHNVSEQPRFEVNAYDSTTGNSIPCSHYTYIAASTLPGFALSGIGTNIYYKSWSTESINLSGYAGRTVALDFATGDCSLGAHFGYGYVDMNCGLFAIQTLLNCDTSSTITLTGPPGFQSYSWRDSASMSTVLDTNQTAHLTRPTATKTYALILTPYTGYGCPDTLYTTVRITSLSVDAGRDTSFCNASSTQLTATGVGTATPLTYSWLPSTGLSCTTCSNPIATVSATRTYYVTVKDANNCVKSDSVKINISTMSVSVTPTNVSCFGGNSGSATVAAINGVTPYTYSWNTSPIKTTATATGLTIGKYIVTVTDSMGCIRKDSTTLTQPTQLNASISATTKVGCNGGNNGSATVSVTGGTAAYTYSWNTSPSQTTTTATGLTAGNYIVTVTDNKGCTDTALASITQPTALIASAGSVTNVSCHGGNNGTASVNVTGGTAGYTYSWNTSPVKTTSTITGLAAGTYIATVTDTNGCSDTALVIVNEPAVLNASISSTTNASCYGTATGAATVSVTGGISAYTYSWNTSPAKTTATASGLAAGSYIVTVTDNKGCTDTALAIITQPTAVQAAILSTTQVNCSGAATGIIVAGASGGTPSYTYSWNTSPTQTSDTAKNLGAGAYVVTVTDSRGCTDTAWGTITQYTSLSASISSSTNLTCHGSNNGAASVSVTGGAPSYTYSWNTTPVRTTASISGLSAGTYTVTVTDNNGCQSFASIGITEPGVLNAYIDSLTNINCYGNNTGMAKVAVTGGTTAYSYSWNTSPVRTTSKISGLPSGTYIVTVTDSKGCTDTAVATLTQPSGPLNASIGSLTNVACYGNNNGAATTTVTGGTPSYTYIWNTTPIQTTASISGVGAGNYIVTVTDNKGCTDTALAIITQPAALVASISSINNISCNGGNNGAATVSISGGSGGYVYSWNTTPPQTSTTLTGVTAGSYTFTVTDSLGCSDTALANITQPNILIASITSATMATCNGSSNGTATVGVTGGTSAYSYSWNTSPAQTNATATSLNAGLYIVTVTDSKGCVDTSAVMITQPSALSVSIPISTNVSCYNGNNGTATALATNGTSPYTYSWNTSPAQTTVTATGLNAGLHRVTVTDSNGCTATANITLTQPTLLNAGISGVTNINCNGGNDGTATVATTGGTTPYAYSWNTVPPQTAITATTLDVGLHIVTVTDANGCTDTAVALITQPAVLNASIGSITNVSCNGSTNGTATVTVTGGTSAYTYSWNTTPVKTTASATGLGAGSYVVTVTDSKGCIDTALATITQPTALSTSITANNVSCYDGNNGAALAKPAGGTTPYTYSWNTTPVQTTAAATSLTAGTYTATITDKNGCIATASVQITQPAAFNASATPTKQTCVNLANGEALGAVSGGVPPYTYNWNTTPTQSTLGAVNLYAGNYSFIITDANGCTASANVTITNFPEMQLEITGDQDLCENHNVQLLVKGAASYKWDNASSLSCSTCANPIARPISSTTYHVIAVDSNSCVDTASVTLSIISRKDVGNGPDQDICEGTTAQLSAGGGVEYTWSPESSLNDAHIPNPISHTKETTKYRVIIKENECFTDTLYQTINVFPVPTIDLGPDKRVAPGTAVQLNAAMTNANHIEWTPTDNLSCTDCTTPIATVPKTITYKAVATNQAGCRAEDDITIFVSCDGSIFFVPNTFTPNGDGLNDIFMPSVKGATTIRRMAIYNRWGQMIFEVRNVSANDARYGWDGTFNNVELKPDVFVYVIEGFCSNGEPISVKGDISLIR